MAVAGRVARGGAVASPPPAGGSVNFGADGFFTGALGLPEGNYAIGFHTQMYQPTKADGTPSRTPAFLAVIASVYPIDPQSGALIGEMREVPFGCGSGAHESFIPSADGKGFDAVPNGKAAGMWGLSAWGLLFDSLKNAGLPPGLVTTSLEPLDGIWVHTQNIPEPEEKKEFARRARAKTGAAAMGGQAEEPDRVRTVTIVTEILENGKPWEGTGGIPEVESAPAAAPAPRQVGRAAAPAARAAGPRPVTRQAPPPLTPAADEESLATAALEALSEVLGRNPNGMTKVALKTGAFQECKKKAGDDVAQLVMSDYLQSDETLGALLGELGFAIQGVMVKLVG